MFVFVAADVVFTLHVDMLMVTVVFINAIWKILPKASEETGMLVITTKSPFSKKEREKKAPKNKVQ